MKSYTPATLVTLTAAALVAFSVWVYVDRNVPDATVSQPETFSFGGKIKSVGSGNLVLETYAIVPDPSGNRPPTVQTQDRSVRVDSRTIVLTRTTVGSETSFKDGSMADVAPGREAVVYTDTRPVGNAQPYAQKIEVVN